MRANQQRLGTPVEAIEFSLLLDDRWDAHAFLTAWQHGDDLSEWPEYAPRPIPADQLEPPPAMYVLSALILLFLAWIFFEAFGSGGHPLFGLFIAALLAMPAALLLHAGGIKAPDFK